MEMKTDTVYGPQWTHPHPSFSPSERWVVYASDVSGRPQVYAAAFEMLTHQRRMLAELHERLGNEISRIGIDLGGKFFALLAG